MINIFDKNNNKLLKNFLTNVHEREKNFQQVNSLKLDEIVKKYPAMSGKVDKNNLLAACTGSYPGSLFESKQAYNNSIIQLNYIDEINKIVKNPQNSMIKNMSIPEMDISAQQSYYNSLQRKPLIEGFMPMRQKYIPTDAPNNNKVMTNTTPSDYSNGIYGANYQDYQDFVKQFNQPLHDNRTILPDITQRNIGIYDSSQFADRQNIIDERGQFEDKPIMDHAQFISSNYGGYGQNEGNSQEALYLQDTGSRPISDFTHNNMVPYAKKYTQNMAGTGVRSGNVIDGVNFDSGSDMSTPYQTKLATFTGIDDTYMHKREAPTMYSPAEQQTGFVYGMPLIRPDPDQYTQSMKYRRDLAPVQAEQVGPGLALDPSIPANGGFHDFTRVMPNNVSDYKANQLEGRINAGKLVSGGELPTSYPGIGTSIGRTDNNAVAVGVPRNRPPTYYTQARRPTMTTKVSQSIDGPLIRSEYQVDLRPRNATREQTNYGYGNIQAGYPTSSQIPQPNGFRVIN